MPIHRILLLLLILLVTMKTIIIVNKNKARLTFLTFFFYFSENYLFLYQKGIAQSYRCKFSHKCCTVIAVRVWLKKCNNNNDNNEQVGEHSS